jgi:hypothetical protein
MVDVYVTSCYIGSASISSERAPPQLVQGHVCDNSFHGPLAIGTHKPRSFLLALTCITT